MQQKLINEQKNGRFCGQINWHPILIIFPFIKGK